VTQREVGVDTDSPAMGLQAALRQDPDVVVVGDITDADTLSTTLKAAESGLLVIGTMATPDVVSTVQHCLAMFPAEEREIGRMRLAESLSAVVAQQLLPRKDGEGRVAAVEMLVVSDAARELLRSNQTVGKLRKLMADSDLMQTFGEHLAALTSEGLVDDSTARAAQRGAGGGP
jgi:twitching motility protein PilT